MSARRQQVATGLRPPPEVVAARCVQLPSEPPTRLSGEDLPMILRRISAAAKAATVVLLFHSAHSCFAQSGAHPPPAGGGRQLSDVVAGIVHYTRWPEAGAGVRFCVSDEYAGLAAAIARQFDEASPDKRLVSPAIRRIDMNTMQSLLECQAIYFGDVPAQVWRPLLPELVKHPILTIGHGDDFCSYGGLFCLESTESSLRLRANLDSIALTGLRVNPQLLRLTQRERAR